MWPELRVDRVIDRCCDVLRERDRAAAADALSERAQAVGSGRAVPREAAALAAGRRLGLGLQRAAKVPSRCSSAFEVFCAAGSDDASVLPGAAA